MEEKDVYAELSSIRALMERSSKFISVSGLAGVLAGVYALAGALMSSRIIANYSASGSPPENLPVLVRTLIVVALAVLILSVMTSYWLTLRKAKRKKESIWNPVSRRLLVASGIPFFTGGFFMLIMLWQGQYTFIAAACLIFYGLALVAGSQFTYMEVKWLGIGEILLGLIALGLPGNDLLLWTLGFGLLHLLYGSIMHFKYER